MDARLSHCVSLLPTAIFASLFSTNLLNSQVLTDVPIPSGDVIGVVSTPQGAQIFGKAWGKESFGVFRWTNTTGFSDVSGPPLSPYDFLGEDVSANGSVIVGRGSGSGENLFRPSAYRLPIGGEYQELATNIRDDQWKVRTRVSDDGSAVTGFNAISGFQWTEKTGIVSIGAKLNGTDVVGPDNQFFSANALSSNGSVVVGTNTLSFQGNGEAARWTAATGPQGLGTGNEDRSTASGVSGDGLIVVGTTFWNSSEYSYSEAFRWTDATGMVALLEQPGGPGPSSFATGISADGSLIVGGLGSYHDQLNSEPFVWTAASGMQRLVDLLTVQYGLGDEIAGWQLGNIVDLSADGRFLVGNGVNPDGRDTTWLVDLGMSPIPEPSTYGLMGAVGLLTIITIRRRRITHNAITIRSGQ